MLFQVHAVEVSAKIKNELTGKEEIKKYHLIVKSQPMNDDARRLLQPSHTFEKEVQMYAQVFHDMANYVRRESVITLNCKDSEVIDVPRCFYTRWAGDDNMKEDLIILENLYPQVRGSDNIINGKGPFNLNHYGMDTFRKKMHGNSEDPFKLRKEKEGGRHANAI